MKNQNCCLPGAPLVPGWCRVPWGTLGVVLGSSWGRPGVVLGSSWGRLGVLVGVHLGATFSYPRSEIYDIGTEILIFHCFATKMLESFCKSTIFSGICCIFCVLYFCSIKTWFKALWDFFSKKCWKFNLFRIWKIQNVEQVQLVSDPILPASETFNQTLKNVKYCKNMKIKEIIASVTLTKNIYKLKCGSCSFVLVPKYSGDFRGTRWHHKMILKYVVNASEMLFNDFEMFCLWFWKAV